ncbi:hypothetical protein AAFF_G00012320 [Aldrovandia affinis]|uniref:Uncharacterized protein n=1 Tax=Aldrovandia affinis TaxID=143900 RepID=A0AAD7S6N6_9TELE|nr:hypothetical protein AAFF_G00012320 [Aldrovandia affinis]
MLYGLLPARSDKMTTVMALAAAERSTRALEEDAASRREFRAHLEEVITLKPRYSTLDQVNSYPSSKATSMQALTAHSREDRKRKE